MWRLQYKIADHVPKNVVDLQNVIIKLVALIVVKFGTSERRLIAFFYLFGFKFLFSSRGRNNLFNSMIVKRKDY